MCVCVHAVGKMAKDIGMTIRKSIVVSFLSCSAAFFGIPSLYVLSFFKYIYIYFCYLFLLFFEGAGENHGWLWLRLAATYIDDSHTVQMYN